MKFNPKRTYMNTEITTNSSFDVNAKIEIYENIFSDLRAILEARIVDNSDEKLQYVHVIGEFIFQNLIPFIDKLSVIVSENSREVFQKISERFDKWVYAKQKPWLDKKNVIGIIGKFSSGKSSLINSILGKPVLPVHKTTTTAIPTYLTYGEKIDVRFADFEGNIRELKSIIFEKFRKDYFEEIGLNIAAMIKYFVVEYPNPTLRNVSILDTPGYNSIDSTDRQKTLSVIKESNLVLWVVDIQDGNLQRDALDFIEENLKNIPLVIIVNKADQIPILEQREEVLDLIRATLERRGIPFLKCFTYSNKNEEMQQDLYSVIQEIHEVEKFEFEAFIGETIIEAKEIISECILMFKEKKYEIDEKMESIKENFHAFHNEFIESYRELVKNWEFACGYLSNYSSTGFFSDTPSVKITSDFINRLQITENSINEVAKKFDALQEQNNLAEFGGLFNALETIDSKLNDLEGMNSEIFKLEETFKSIIK